MWQQTSVTEVQSSGDETKEMKGQIVSCAKMKTEFAHDYYRIWMRNKNIKDKLGAKVFKK